MLFLKPFLSEAAGFAGYFYLGESEEGQSGAERSQLTFLPKYTETNTDEECHGIPAPQHDSEEEQTRNLSD